MGEAKDNLNSAAKEEGKKNGFAPEVESIAIITKLAEIGLESLKLVDYDMIGDEEKAFVDTLKNSGPSVIKKFIDSADWLYQRGMDAKLGINK